MLTKTSFTIRLHPNDDVVIARQQPVSGTTLIDENVKVSGLIPPGHKVATRATVAHGIADAFKGAALAQVPNVDGVVALTHGSGCGMDVQGESMQVLRRTLGGYAKHANFAGALIVGLGCEANQINALLGAESLQEGPLLHTFSIQDTGGTGKSN